MTRPLSAADLASVRALCAGVPNVRFGEPRLSPNATEVVVSLERLPPHRGKEPVQPTTVIDHLHDAQQGQKAQRYIVYSAGAEGEGEQLYFGRLI